MGNISKRVFEALRKEIDGSIEQAFVNDASSPMGIRAVVRRFDSHPIIGYDMEDEEENS